jgi:hypothetical protein
MEGYRLSVDFFAGALEDIVLFGGEVSGAVTADPLTDADFVLCVDPMEDKQGGGENLDCEPLMLSQGGTHLPARAVPL